MSYLPILKPEIVEKVIFRLGFTKLRQKGSHVFYKHPDGRTTVIPFHKNYELPKSLIRSILREINISVEKFIKEYRNLLI